MSLETLYNDAALNTYVGLVRSRQAADSPTNKTLVNFLDGQAKGEYSKGRPLAPDTFQREFTRNQPRTFLTGGAQGVTRNPSQSYTRWTSKAFKLAFDGEGPSNLSQGFYTNAFRPQYRSIDGTMQRVHTYTPNEGKKFKDLNTSARTRINSSPSGAPASL